MIYDTSVASVGCAEIMFLGEQPIFFSKVTVSGLEDIPVYKETFPLPPAPEGIPLNLLAIEFYLLVCCPSTWYCFTLLCTFLQSGVGWIMQPMSILHVNTVTLLHIPFSKVTDEQYNSCGDPAGNSSFFIESRLI